MSTPNLKIIPPRRIFLFLTEGTDILRAAYYDSRVPVLGGEHIYKEVLFGIFIPFVGTTLGAACVFLTGKGTGRRIHRAIEGFSAGVMVAASIWSLLIPSMELAEKRGSPAAVPAASGFLCGIVFFLFCDRLITRITEKISCGGLPRKSFISVFAIIVHNLPEGMAVGAIYAEILCQSNALGVSAALALSIGIAVQNFPEGAIVSVPIKASGAGKLKAFAIGALSGAVEPLGAVLTVMAAGIAVPLLPYLLGFAAGAMMYAVLEEFTGDGESGGAFGVLAFSAGFVLMMSLDVFLG